MQRFSARGHPGIIAEMRLSTPRRVSATDRNDEQVPRVSEQEFDHRLVQESIKLIEVLLVRLADLEAIEPCTHRCRRNRQQDPSRKADSLRPLDRHAVAPGECSYQA